MKDLIHDQATNISAENNVLVCCMKHTFSFIHLMSFTKVQLEFTYQLQDLNRRQSSVLLLSWVRVAHAQQDESHISKIEKFWGMNITQNMAIKNYIPINVDESLRYHSGNWTTYVRSKCHICNHHTIIEYCVWEWWDSKERNDSKLLKPAPFSSKPKYGRFLRPSLQPCLGIRIPDKWYGTK